MKRQLLPANIKPARVISHVAFWIIVFLIFVVVYSFKSNYSIAAHNNVMYLPIHMAYFYLLAYWLIPNYLLRGRYILFSAWLLLFVFGSAFLGRVVDVFIVEPYIVEKGANDYSWDAIKELKQSYWHRLIIPVDFINSLKMMNMVVWFAIVFKIFKLWYERKQAATKAELKALKAQIHPHFLFNTLNNLYGLTLNNSPKAPGVVIGLSDMLRYMLYECNDDKVSLKKEVLMLQHYIDLEKIRYEERLDLTFNISGKLDDKLIAPLMLLTLVENAFKHGASERVGQAWINITLDVTDNKLKFKVSNSKADTSADDGVHHGHIGLQNLKKRLDLLYPSTHQLRVMDEDDVFLAILELELSVSSSLSTVNQPVLA